MIKAFFGLSAFAFKKDTGEIFVSRQMGYLQKRGAHFLETQGMALLTGEIGSGKTTFVRWFLNSLDRHSYQHFYLSQTVRHSTRAVAQYLKQMAEPA
ncbi:MAG: AAA family ATPase [Elusimicrobia bacterium]|nr:AAA family ATPase [Elusimicrobiota bacterium]